jgi:NADPH:quinone reductase-like Zn-dependent oxidoreductase
VSGVTALQAVRDAGRVNRGQHVLVIGAAGGVGSYAVQLAKSFGAEVTGVCRTAKLDFVRSLGADHVIDYTREDFAAGPRRYDLIIDIAGNPTIARLRRALTPTGTVVITGGEEGDKWTGGMDRQMRGAIRSLFGRQRLTSFIGRQRLPDLELLAGLIEAGTVTPSLDRAYPLEEAPEAMRQLAAGNVRGKVAITC